MTTDKKPPMAVCRYDDEPLVLTFEIPKKEFVCVICGRWYEFLEPKAMEWSQELQDRHDELDKQYDEERKARESRNSE